MSITCSRCGRSLSDNDYYKKKNGKRMYTWCKDCHKKMVALFRRTPIGKRTEMKKDAKKRGIGFTLTIDDVKNLWKKPCGYCGNKMHILCLDRINNTLPYSKDNVVPCCKWCNYNKADGSAAFLYERCKKVVENMPIELRKNGDPLDGGNRYTDYYKKYV
jgi:hypothetical protein